MALRIKRDIRLSTFSAITSIFTVLIFHIPFFSHAAAGVNLSLNGIIIIGSLAALLLAINYMMTYLVLWLARTGGKVILAISLLLNATSLYFINTFDIIIDDTMMGNVFNTNTAETTSYFSPGFVAYILFAGILPSVLVFIPKIDFGKAKRFFANVGISLGLILAIAFGNITNWPWIDQNSTVLGSLILPWSYTVNTVRFFSARARNNKQEILLPDATIQSKTKEAVVLIIGESDRRDHFSLYGYKRETNPLLSKRKGLKTYEANSAATYTTAGVKAILDHKPTDELYETLPNYLYRSGADVIWRTSNWGQSPLHIEKYYDVAALNALYPETATPYDEILAQGLRDVIAGSDKDKVLVVLHTSASHGPSYEQHYPKEFEVFSPVNTKVEMSQSIQAELFNSYDNSLIYTDYVIDRVAEELSSLPPEWKSCLIFISDHGESLGENKLYMHGVPISIAPREQYEIPFIVWSPDNSVEYKDIETPCQYNIFHSILNFLEISSPVYDEKMNVFKTSSSKGQE